MITIFKNGIEILDAHYITAETALKRIRDGNSKETVDKIRNYVQLGGKKEKKEQYGEFITKLKKSLPSVLFHGRFDKPITKTGADGEYKSVRDDVCMSTHSGLLVLDIDGIAGDEVLEMKEKLKSDKYIYACWVSPSGEGLKALVKCPPNKDKHYEYYDALIEHLPNLDTTSRSLSRLCFESYDPEIYINRNSEVWDKVIVSRKPKEIKQYNKSNRNYKAFDAAVSMVRSSYDGIKHDTLIKAAKLLGGHIAGGTVDEDEAFKVLVSEITAKGVKDTKGAEKAIRDGFEYGKSAPIYRQEPYIPEKVSYAKKVQINDEGKIDVSQFIVTSDSINKEAETYFNNGAKWRGLGLPQLDRYLPWRDNSFQTIVGGKGSGKTTLMLYLFAQDSWVNGTKRFIRSYENDAMELQNEVIGFLCGNNAEWIYRNDRAKYNWANEFFHEHFTLLKFPPDTDFFQITDYAAKLNSQSAYSQLFIDPLFKVPETDDYSKNKKIAAYCEPFATDVMSLFVSMHPNGSTQRAGGQPKDLDAEFGAVYSNAADITMTVARDYKDSDPSVRNTVNIAIDKVRSKKLFGGTETPKDSPIKFEYQWKTHQYRVFVPVEGNEDYYDKFDDVFFK